MQVFHFRCIFYSAGKLLIIATVLMVWCNEITLAYIRRQRLPSFAFIEISLQSLLTLELRNTHAGVK